MTLFKRFALTLFTVLISLRIVTFGLHLINQPSDLGVGLGLSIIFGIIGINLKLLPKIWRKNENISGKYRSSDNRDDIVG